MERKENTYRKVPKTMLWRCWFWFMFLHMTCQTFDRGYGNAFTAAIVPILRYLYKGCADEEAQIREGLQRTRNYYLCEQSFSGVLFAIIVGMEEKKAHGENVNGDMIFATKNGIMGPMSGMGDTIHGSTIRQFGIAVTILLCLSGNVAGSVLMLIAINISPFATAFLNVNRGYREGSAFVLNLLKNGKLQGIAHAASTMNMFIMGGVAAAYVSIRTGLVFGGVSIQNILDLALPGILVLAVIFLYFLLINKKIRINKIIFGTAVASVLFTVLHIIV